MAKQESAVDLTSGSIRLPLAYVLAVAAGYGALGVWMAMVISMCFQGILMTLRFRKGRWKLVNV